ncbi:MAG: cupin domain-containing protein [Nanoarchaeota archaeon]|nr:cupin domain-containing protein [Nanoarchaeota archaeon]
MIKKVNKVWGSEEWIVNNNLYCGKILNLSKGFRCSFHYHKSKHETFYILEGKVLLELEDNKVIMNPGDIQIIEPNQKHRFTGLENSKIIEFSTHHEDSDCYRDTQSESIDLDKLKEEFGII